MTNAQGQLTATTHDRLRWFVTAAALVYAGLSADFAVMAFGDEALQAGVAALVVATIWVLIAVGVWQGRRAGHLAAMVAAAIEVMRLLILVSPAATAWFVFWLALAVGVLIAASRLRHAPP